MGQKWSRSKPRYLRQRVFDYRRRAEAERFWKDPDPAGKQGAIAQQFNARMYLSEAQDAASAVAIERRRCHVERFNGRQAAIMEGALKGAVILVEHLSGGWWMGVSEGRRNA